MANFLQAQEKAKQLKRSQVRNDFFAFIRSIEKELEAYNVSTIYNDSEDVNKKPIGYYSRATEIITDGRKKEGEPFDLLETGDFLDGLFARVGRNAIFFDTKDPKKKEVFKNLLTTDIFGLQDEDLKAVIDTRLLPFLIDYFKLKLF